MSRIVSGPWSTHPTSTIRVRSRPGAEPHPSRRVDRDRAPARRLDGVPGVGLGPWRGHRQAGGRPDRGRDRDHRPSSRGRRRGRPADHDGRRWRLGGDLRSGGRHLSLPGLVARRDQDRRYRDDPDGHAVHAFTVPKPGVGGSSSAVPTAIDRRPSTRRPWAGRSTCTGRRTALPHVPDHRTWWHRAATGSADGTQPVTSCARRCRSIGPGGGRPDACAQRRDGPGAFLGEVSRDGSTAADLGVQPATSRRRRALAMDGTAATSCPPRMRRITWSSKAATGPAVTRYRCSAGVCRLRSRWRRAGLYRAGQGGPPVTVPVGPLRVFDARSGPCGPCSQVTSSPSSGRPTDGPSLRSGSAHRTTRSRWRAAPGPPRRHWVSPSTCRRRRGLGLVRRERRCAWPIRRPPGPPLLRPTRAQPPAVAPDWSAIVVPLVAETRRPAGRSSGRTAPGSGGSPPVSSGSGALRTRSGSGLVQTSCVHYSRKRTADARDASLTTPPSTILELDPGPSRSRPPAPIAAPDRAPAGWSGDRHRARRCARHEHRRNQLPPAQAASVGLWRRPTATAANGHGEPLRRCTPGPSTTSKAIRTPGPRPTGSGATTCVDSDRYERWLDEQRRGRSSGRTWPRERLRPPAVAGRAGRVQRRNRGPVRALSSGGTGRRRRGGRTGPTGRRRSGRRRPLTAPTASSRSTSTRSRSRGRSMTALDRRAHVGAT